MIVRKDIRNILKSYDLDNLSIGTLGSHEFLNISRGAKDMGFRSVVVAKEDDKAVKYLKSRYRPDYGEVGCIDKVIYVNDWMEMASMPVIKQLQELNTINVIHRSQLVYLTHHVVQNMQIPIFGNRTLPQLEERTVPEKLPYNQDDLMRDAGIPVPKSYDPKNLPANFAKPVLVKATQAIGDRPFERRFAKVRSREEYETECTKAISRGKNEMEKEIIEKNFRSAVVQEFVDGPDLNSSYFYSPFHGLELLGNDRRIQSPNGREMLHVPVSPKGSLYNQIFEYGERLVQITQEKFHPGIVGPFALQGICNDEGKIIMIDCSLRIPGSPDKNIASYYMYGEEMTCGKRIAGEIKYSAENGMLEEVVS